MDKQRYDDASERATFPYYREFDSVRPRFLNECVEAFTHAHRSCLQAVRYINSGAVPLENSGLHQALCGCARTLNSATEHILLQPELSSVALQKVGSACDYALYRLGTLGPTAETDPILAVAAQSIIRAQQLSQE